MSGLVGFLKFPQGGTPRVFVNGVEFPGVANIELVTDEERYIDEYGMVAFRPAPEPRVLINGEFTPGTLVVSWDPPNMKSEFEDDVDEMRRIDGTNPNPNPWTTIGTVSKSVLTSFELERARTEEDIRRAYGLPAELLS